MDSDIVTIEHCINCKSHAWCTNHDETKYQNYFEKVKISIEHTCPELMINENVKDKLITSLLASKSGKFLFSRNTFPRIGTFEVYFRGQIIYSKLKEGKWPNPVAIADKIRNILDGVYVTEKKDQNNFQESRRTFTSSGTRSKSVKNLSGTNTDKKINKNAMIKTSSEVFQAREQALDEEKPKHRAIEFKDDEHGEYEKQKSLEKDKRVFEEEKHDKPHHFPQEKHDEPHDYPQEKHDKPHHSPQESYKFSEKNNEKNHSNEAFEVKDHEEKRVNVESLNGGDKDVGKPDVEDNKKKEEGDGQVKSITEDNVVNNTEKKDDKKEVTENFSKYPVTKSYDIQIQAGLENFKKFPVNNENDIDMNIKVYASDSSIIKVNNDAFVIAPRTKGIVKFSLISQVPDNKIVYLLLKNNGEMLENYELKIQFS
ncbi:hypothetical protein SteCoe_19146 [Stentor coeruleus]|uniref:Uncharacterized protein n=1 Tax=Stentor coeruleus TaxID=5963 RepID=A0A1R2BV31_9CILI|nr:hypothetical protein SteCoe_19146 [Stentor coeruleus]